MYNQLTRLGQVVKTQERRPMLGSMKMKSPPMFIWLQPQEKHLTLPTLRLVQKVWD
jgi:hypothetical protein